MTTIETLNKMVDGLCGSKTSNVIAVVDGESVRVKFPYSPAAIDLCKSAGGRWNHDNRSWDWTLFGIPRALQVMEPAALDLGKEIGAALRAVHEKRADLKTQLEVSRAEMNAAIDNQVAVPGMIRNAMLAGSPILRPFQERGVSFLEVRKNYGIIADEMGLGKSPQALAFLAIHPELRPAVIVVPNPAVCQWEKFLARWLGLLATRMVRKDHILANLTPFYIVPWSMISKLKEVLSRLRPKCFVFDEGHYIKSISTDRTKAVMELSKIPSVESVLFLTGTPMLNRPVEIWPMLNIVSRGTFGGFNEFRNRYCGPKVQRFGRRVVTTFNGATNLDELALRLSKWVIRRTKAEVAPELPPKSRVTVQVEADRASLSVGDRERLEMALEKKDQKKMFEVMAILRRLCGMEKLGNCIQWATDFLESSDQKLVLFAFHVDVQVALAEGLKEFGVVRFAGGQTIDHRGQEQDRFQTKPEYRVAVCSISAAREALDLTAASNLAFVERDWVPGVEAQAEDRIHRLTTTMPVTIYRLMSDHIIDRAIQETVDRKAEVFRSIFGEPGAVSMVEEKIGELILQKALELS